MTESSVMRASETQLESGARSFFEINENKPKAQFEFSEKNFII